VYSGRGHAVFYACGVLSLRYFVDCNLSCACLCTMFYPVLPPRVHIAQDRASMAPLTTYYLPITNGFDQNDGQNESNHSVRPCRFILRWSFFGFFNPCEAKDVHVELLQLLDTLDFLSSILHMESSLGKLILIL